MFNANMYLIKVAAGSSGPALFMLIIMSTCVRDSYKSIIKRSAFAHPNAAGVFLLLAQTPVQPSPPPRCRSHHVQGDIEPSAIGFMRMLVYRRTV